ncbi:MAG: MBL fold metallo-hydrolase [Clostridia bacterium]|nr:MBL fold metallo-hydrolase [Clostridia bacterium]
METRSRYEFDPDARTEYFLHPENHRIPGFRIFGNLFFVGDADAGAHLVDTGDGLILIDTGYPTARTGFLQSILEAGFDPANVRILLHTHGHFDHFGATADIVARSGAQTCLGAADARMFRENPALALTDIGWFADAPLFRPDRELEDGDIIALGSVTVRAVATPGHSDGVMSYFFDVTENGRTLTAGLLGGAGLNTLCRPFVERFSRTHARADFVRSLAKVRSEKVDITLGNHAPQNRTPEKRARQLACTDASNPFVDPAEWAGMIDGIRAAYDRMLQDERDGTDRV